MSRVQDFLGLLRGIQLVAQESLKTQTSELKVIWSNSSVRIAVEGAKKETETLLKNAKTKSADDVFKSVVEGAERVNTVLTGIKYFTTNSSTLETRKLSDEKGLLLIIIIFVTNFTRVAENSR